MPAPRPPSGRPPLRACVLAVLVALAGCSSVGLLPSTETPRETATTAPPTTTTAVQTTTTADRCFEPDATHTYVVLTEVNESYVERWSGTLDVVAAADLAPDKREVVSEAADTDCRVPSDAFSARSDRHPDVVAVDGSYYWLLVERKLVTVESL